MPSSQITRSRVIDRSTCVLGFSGNQYQKSYVFDATTLVADSNGFFQIPSFSFVTKSTSDPTKIKVFQGLGTDVNAQQTLTETGTPTGGTFKITFNGQQTTALAFGASAATIQAALVALTNIGAGNVACTGGPVNTTPVVITFQGLLGNQPIPIVTVDNTGLTGGASPAVTPSSSVTGQAAEHIIGVFDNLDADLFGNSVANNTPVAIYDQYTAFNTTKLANWLSFGATARAALPTCTFQP